MTLNRITRTDIVAACLARHNATAINGHQIPHYIAHDQDHWIMDDDYANLFAFLWTGPGVYNVMFALTNDARLVPAVTEAIAYARALRWGTFRCKTIWAAERPDDPASAFGMKLLGMKPTGTMAFVGDRLKPVWRRGFV